MAKIAVLIDDLFEDSEYQQPAEAFKKAGHQLTHIGLRAGAEVTGKRQGYKVKIDTAVGDVSPAEFDALLIPGGYSPDRLRSHPKPVGFVREFMQSGKPVFSICHAPQILISAQALAGRKVTGWKSIVQDIKNAGAEYEDSEVVVDRNLVSSRSPEDLPAFIGASLEQLA